MTDLRYPDPDCTCTSEHPARRHNLCESCRIFGPLPGSLADPDWETTHRDPAVLRRAADRLADRVPPVTAGPWTDDDRLTHA
ncbi:hypothetical protein, partial [Streptomyces clavuligerus]